VIAVDGEDKETREQVAEFARRNKLTHRILLGGERVSERYEVEKIFPTTFWIDHRGIVVRREVGFRPEMKKEIEQMILELLRARDDDGKKSAPPGTTGPAGATKAPAGDAGRPGDAKAAKNSTDPEDS
jgi:hypothetical protein